MARNRSQDKYLRIILAATKVFARKGFFHSRISDIAKEAKVADGTIYIYFENKDAILIALFEEQMKSVIENMISQLGSQTDCLKKLEIFAFTHLELIEQNQDMAEIIQVELRQSGKFMKEYKNEGFAKYLDIIAEIVRQGQSEGIFRKDVIPNVFKRAFFGALDEMSRFWVLSSRRQYDIRTAARQISEYFVNGIRG
ncbi:MAG: TetR family transcriptional regulator [Deltaproteobacteria bacterium CG_4_8_14_3_um_filter_51_11]|nr:TetR/AcrR family transcriptional regulator [bacterium]OIP38344.1 MAG: TetR family transcriptional regulator [Desulfobacteraceae bacterium CG2_30_51_40]PIP44964.1 MAG: TetR family transcriptional regulator [Deltaproteobacteria bacterium CG23_combo_of_CG06-09_8_20_14_all_51_20]PIX20629.1 MAG: TetR family transcriptional regulator [Deltaproteobacteria bacterium CG_4_8_14_3_um_filter_51_11]PIY27149.1 MAG: TetR family transcriptional regulator [Deltaproteobacteria bacterium CG_4_10_14_3_um_filter